MPSSSAPSSGRPRPRHAASLTLSFGNPAQAQAVLQALGPELLEGPEGSAATGRLDGAAIHVEVEAADVAGLRAALNSVLRLADTARRVAGTGPGHQNR